MYFKSIFPSPREGTYYRPSGSNSTRRIELAKLINFYGNPKDSAGGTGDADAVVYAPPGDGHYVVRLIGLFVQLYEGFFIGRNVMVREPVLQFFLPRSPQRPDPVSRFPRAFHQFPGLVGIQNQHPRRLFHLLAPIPNLFFHLKLRIPYTKSTVFVYEPLNSALPYTKSAVFVYEPFDLALSYTRSAVFVYDGPSCGSRAL